MKLPELKEKLKSKYIVRVVAGVLTIALVGTGIGATAVFAPRTSNTLRFSVNAAFKYSLKKPFTGSSILHSSIAKI